MRFIYNGWKRTSYPLILTIAMPSSLTQTDFERIVQQKNLLVRNLQITQGYYQVSQSLRKFVSSSNVNWFSFGTYASKTAGRAMRHENLPGPLKSALIRSAGYENTYIYLNKVLEDPALTETTPADNLLSQVLAEVSLLISEGNLLIFSELAWPFTHMVKTFTNAWQPDEAKWASFLDEHFRPGPFEEGGQDWLRESITSFYQARFETDSKRKAELIYLGNLLVGLHEQTRLQPIIERAVAVPFDVFSAGLIPHEPEDGDGVENPFRDHAVGFSRRLVLRTVTRMWMTYTLPTREMKLGKDVVAPTGMVSFPPELLSIENERVQEIIQPFDTGVDTLSGSAAANWARLEDRMGYIVDFFRSYQRYQPLFRPPFLKNQVPVIKSGHFPGGPL
jgi:hypothetical protein